MIDFSLREDISIDNEKCEDYGNLGFKETKIFFFSSHKLFRLGLSQKLHIKLDMEHKRINLIVLNLRYKNMGLLSHLELYNQFFCIIQTIL
jgi:hypothetical protein